LQQIAEHLTVAIYQAQLYQLQQQNTLEAQVIEQTQALRDTYTPSTNSKSRLR
jgi:hypothetical protein